jgi:hypothetical protein
MKCGKLFVVGMMLAALVTAVGAMKADASEEGPSPWDALWMGEGFPPAPKAPANFPKAREEKADLKACGCGKGAGQPAGSCGRLRSAVQDLGEVENAAPAICCYPFNGVPCYSFLYRYRRNCYLNCGDPPCPQGKACAMESLPNGQAYICTDVEWEEYNCSICCSSLLGSCSGLDCPADCPPGFSKQYPMSCGKIVSTVVQGIPYECNCR